ncbi:MAG: hypothetical protein GEU90_05710 [Gemmatimonas sp.]|nr:hypothetical protein [Gemmatimonas sp.]
MTIQEFQSLYTIVRPLSDRGAHSFLATGRHGQVVMVHVLDIGSKEERHALEAKLDSLRGDARDRIVDIMNVEGITTVVTRFMLDFETFTGWIEGQGAAPPPRKSGPGEFTRLFQTVENSGPESGGPWSSRSADEVGDEKRSADPASEVTQVFRAKSTATPVPDDPPPSTPEKPRTGADSSDPIPTNESPTEEVGEFTRMFRAAPAPSDEHTGRPTDPVPEAPGAGSEVRHDDPQKDPSGEFTRLFRATASPPAEGPGVNSKPGPAATPTPEPTHPPPEPAGEPGEFTRAFRAVQAPRPDVAQGSDHLDRRGQAPPPPAEASPPEPGEFTRTFRAAKSPDDTIFQGNRGPVSGKPVDTGAAGEESRELGPYTQMFRTRGTPPDRSDSSPAGAPADSVAPDEKRRAPGDFTKMFQALSRTPLGPQPSGSELRPQSPSTDSESYLDRLYNTGSAPPKPVEPPKPVDPPQTAAPPRWLPPLPSEMATKAPAPQPEPGTYTRIVRAAQKPSASSAAPTGPRRSSPRPMILFGLAVVVLVTLFLILYIVLRTQLTPASSEAPADSAAVAAPARPDPGTP